MVLMRALFLTSISTNPQLSNSGDDRGTKKGGLTAALKIMFKKNVN